MEGERSIDGTGGRSVRWRQACRKNVQQVGKGGKECSVSNTGRRNPGLGKNKNERIGPLGGKKKKKKTRRGGKEKENSDQNRQKAGGGARKESRVARKRKQRMHGRWGGGTCNLGYIVRSKEYFGGISQGREVQVKRGISLLKGKISG